MLCPSPPSLTNRFFLPPSARRSHPAPDAAPDAAAVIGDLRESSQALRQMGHDPLPAVLAQAGGARSTRKATRAATAAAAKSDGELEGGKEAAIPEEGEGAGEEPSPETLAQRAVERGKAKMSLMDRQEGARTLEVRCMGVKRRSKYLRCRVQADYREGGRRGA